MVFSYAVIPFVSSQEVSHHPLFHTDPELNDTSVHFGGSSRLLRLFSQVGNSHKLKAPAPS